MEIISNTPIFVWPLLAYLFWGGWKARKTYIVPWIPLLIMPVVMCIWSIYSILARYGVLSIGYWMVSITLGIYLGSLTVRKLGLKFDKKRKLIEISGNWTPLILSMSIFSLRYFLGAIYGLHPELARVPALLIVENIATIVSGMFMGRLVGYWQRYKTAPHFDLSDKPSAKSA